MLIQILTMATLKKPRLPRLLMTILTVAVMWRPSSGLQCYTCNSHFDAQCGDPFISEAGGVRSAERYSQDCTSCAGEKWREVPAGLHLSVWREGLLQVTVIFTLVPAFFLILNIPK